MSISSLFCPECDAYMYKPEAHKCPPLFEVFIKDYYGEDSEGIKVHAFDGEGAAEKAIEQWDAEGDYTCIGGEEVLVTVKDLEGSVTKFYVTGESRPSYSATEVL